MNIGFDSKDIADYFIDWISMGSKIGMDNARSVKKKYDVLRSATNIKGLFQYRAGKPQFIPNSKTGQMSIKVEPDLNVVFRSNIENSSNNDVLVCDSIVVEGVWGCNGYNEQNRLVP